MTASAEELVARARERISRIRPDELGPLSAAGALIVDIRPAAQRAEEGELPGALVVERNVLEWRLDPSGEYRIPEVTDYSSRWSWSAPRALPRAWLPTRSTHSATCTPPISSAGTRPGRTGWRPESGSPRSPRPATALLSARAVLA